MYKNDKLIITPESPGQKYISFEGPLLEPIKGEVTMQAITYIKAILRLQETLEETAIMLRGSTSIKTKVGLNQKQARTFAALQLQLALLQKELFNNSQSSTKESVGIELVYNVSVAQANALDIGEKFGSFKKPSSEYY